ncbi:MAG: hypothetical protein LBD36_02255 [Holosporales bacterium]|nr:hypothetical protein [Holosporales bacterium]
MLKPCDNRFSSGPTRKIKNWSVQLFDERLLGRSHRENVSLAQIDSLVSSMRHVLGIPNEYEIAIINGGATGATEFLLWNLIGIRPVDVFSYGIFGNHWLHDVKDELKIKDINNYTASIGLLPDFSCYESNNDCVFVWSETPSGTTVPNVEWIPDDRDGVVICDVTSAVFCEDISWKKLDAASFAWQKGIGGEAGLGTIVLSPRAINRLETYTPRWPIPRLYRIPCSIRNGMKILDEKFFHGYTINTISLLVVYDMISCLNWAESIGGLQELIRRKEHNYDIIKKWASAVSWINFLVENEKIRSKNTVCLTVMDAATGCCVDWTFLKKMTAFLEENDIAYGLLNHPHSRPSLRIWTGPVIDGLDLERLLPWIERAYFSIY